MGKFFKQIGRPKTYNIDIDTDGYIYKLGKGIDLKTLRKIDYDYTQVKERLQAPEEYEEKRRGITMNGIIKKIQFETRYQQLLNKGMNRGCIACWYELTMAAISSILIAIRFIK